MPKIVSWRERYEAEARRLIMELPAEDVGDFYQGDDEDAIAYYKSPEGLQAFRENLCEEWVPEASDAVLQRYVDGKHQRWDRYEQAWFTDDTWFQMYND